MKLLLPAFWGWLFSLTGWRWIPQWWYSTNDLDELIFHFSREFDRLDSELAFSRENSNLKTEIIKNAIEAHMNATAWASAWKKAAKKKRALLLGDIDLLGLVDGEITLEHPLLTLQANLMYELFKQQGATNYLQIQMYAKDRGSGGRVESYEELILTIQKVDMKTPHQLREEAEARTATLSASVKKAIADIDADATGSARTRLQQALDDLENTTK